MQHRVRRFNSKSGAHASTSAPRPGTRRGSSASGRTRTSLRESEELHRATLANISDTVLLTDDAGRFTYVCPNVDVIFGCTPDEVHALGSIDALFGAKLFEPGELALRGEIRNIECEVAIGSGLRRTVLVHVKSVSIKGGTRLYCCRDVTELRQAEEEARAARADLAHASRLMMAGALTASIAHEITQPLTAIVGNAGVALEVFQRRGVSSNAAELREILTDIIEEGRQAADIVQRIRALARKRPLSLQALDVNEVAKDALHFLSGDALRRQVALKAELEPALPLVLGDRVCLQQVLLNLLLNGMDAMEGIAAAERRLSIKTQCVDQGVEMVVADSGCGIAADVFPNLFEAFFTTKQDGVGLGLAIAHSIIEAHSGRIWAESDRERGAAFHIALLPFDAPSQARAF